MRVQLYRSASHPKRCVDPPPPPPPPPPPYKQPWLRSRWNSFFTRGECTSCLRACLGARLLLQLYQNLSEGADRIGGQLRGDKECPFSGVTKSGRVWRKVPESDARSVVHQQTILRSAKDRPLPPRFDEDRLHLKDQPPCSMQPIRHKH